MVWDRSSFNAPWPLVFLNGNQASRNYFEMLEENLLSCVDEHLSTGRLFQQDNFLSYISKNTQSWIKIHNVTTLRQHSRSSDLKPIEGLCSNQASSVHTNGTQFNCLQYLKRTVQKVWKKIPLKKFNYLICSMKKCCAAVLRQQGEMTHYQLFDVLACGCKRSPLFFVL